MLSEEFLKGAPLSEATFRNPPRELGVLPFWFWNGKMEPGEMKRQVAQYADKGLAGLFIHARFGLQVPFLSKKWFDRTRLTAEECQKHGLQCWIYDEYNWPSGTAYKAVPTKYPHLQQKYLELIVSHVDGPIFMYMEGYDSRYVRISEGNGKPIAVFAVRSEEWERGELKEVIDLTPNLCFGQVVSWQAPEGQWEILYFMEKPAPWYIDALNPESTQRFIEIGYQSYVEALPDLMGKTVLGFYTDEPAMHYHSLLQDNAIVPWTADMFRLFREHNGYDLKPWLPALFGRMGEQTAKVRYDFWSALSKRYAEAYFGQLRTWCNQHNLLFVGHLLFEEYLRTHARCSGNLFWMLQKLDIVGTDHLYPRIGSPERPEEHVALKIASSAAHHFGSARVLCESLGGTYWDCTMARMKWIADWEYILGINLFNPHGFHYSISDERKRDWPPSQFYHHPWWRHYKLFADYMLRLGYMLSGGRHVAKIALLYPLTTIWANYTPQQHNLESDLCQEDFEYLTDTLLRLHYDFDYIDEEVLAGAEIVGGKLRVGDEAYELLMMPAVTHLRPETVTKLEQFLGAGGKALGCTLLPEENTAGEAIGGRLQALFGMDPKQARERRPEESAGLQPVAKDLAGGGKTVFLHSAGLSRVRDDAGLGQALAGLIRPDIEIEDREVFYLHRVKEGRDIFFLANTSWQAKETTLRLFAAGGPQRWNPEDGSIEQVYHYRPIDGGVELALQLAPLESALIVMGPEPEFCITEANVTVELFGNGEIRASGRPSGEARLQIRSGGHEQTLSLPAGELLPEIAIDSWRLKPEGDNGLVLGALEMQVEGEEAAGWVPVRPGLWEPQFPYERKSSAYPVLLRYRTRFDCRYLAKDLRLLLDGLRGSYEICLNGKTIKARARRGKLDPNIAELPVSEALQEGENLLEINLRVDSPAAGLLDPPRLVGSFSVLRGGELPTVGAPVPQAEVGSLVNQGYPYFSGTMNYLGEFNLSPAYLCERKLLLALDCGTDVAAVEINGKPAGTRPWAPYELDITPFVKSGRNRIVVKITNTVTNLLEGNTLDFGLFGPVRVISLNRYRFGR